MDNYPDLGLFSDLGFNSDQSLDPNQNDLNQPSNDGSKQGPPGPDSGYGSPLQGLLDLPSLLFSLITQIGPAVEAVEKVKPFGWVNALLGLGAHVNGFMVEGAQHVIDMENAVQKGGKLGAAGAAAKSWGFLSRWSGGAFYRGMLELGLGVDTSQFDDDANAGVNTIDTMLTFAFVLQWITGTVDSIGKALFGGRWGEGLSETLSSIPEEMGLSWALGLSIDEAFKVAVGRSVEEGINRQKHGNRIEWPQLRTLLKQHAFEGLTTDGHGKIVGSVSGVPDYPGLDVFKDLLLNEGFPEWQIELLAKLNDVQIPVADIAQLWYRDIINDDRAKELIGELGFSPQQVDWLYTLYIAKSENTASVTYRSLARQMFVNHLINEDMYRSVLNHANYPAKLINDDVAAIKLEQDIGRVLQSVTVIKTMYQRGKHDADVARKGLRDLNYSDAYITDLLNSWDLPPLRKEHGLSQAKVLSYWYSGVIKDRSSALHQLMATGLTTDAANFLLDNPTASHSTLHKLTPGLITQAYVDGALDQNQLSAAYKSTGVTDDALPKYVAVAQYRLSHRKGSPHPTQYPDTALYREAQKLGLIDFQTAVHQYEQLGWTPDDAMLIAEIVNKGPFQQPQPPRFSNLGEAIAYMEQHGYKVIAPPSPDLMAAENLLAMNGYFWELSSGSGGGSGGGGGGGNSQ